MTKKLQRRTIYVSTTIFFPLIIIFLMFAVHFGLVAFEIFSSEIHIGRYGNIHSPTYNPWIYWGGLLKYLSFTWFCIYLTLLFRKNNK
jgi:hypothetical protein